MSNSSNRVGAPAIKAVRAIEILDSRGRPTVAVTVELDDGTTARAGVPSGASTGSGEALELRDKDPERFGGLGVRTAVDNVNGPIAETLVGRVLTDPRDIDAALIELDGTPNKSQLGANAIVGVSMAASRAHAHSVGRPLWQDLADQDATPRLPVPHFNVINGGAHAPNELTSKSSCSPRSARRTWPTRSARVQRSTWR
jgi:enolase